MLSVDFLTSFFAISVTKCNQDSGIVSRNSWCNIHSIIDFLQYWTKNHLLSAQKFQWIITKSFLPRLLECHFSEGFLIWFKYSNISLQSYFIIEVESFLLFIFRNTCLIRMVEYSFIENSTINLLFLFMKYAFV